MKQTTLFAFLILLLTGCTGKNDENSDQNQSAPSLNLVIGGDTTQTDSLLAAEPNAPADSVSYAAEQNTPDASVSQKENSEPLTISTFCKWDSSEKLMTTLPANKVKKNLTGLNFTQRSSKLTWEGIDDASGEYDKVYKVKYTREANGEFISVELKYSQNQYGQFLWDVEIEFPNSKLKDDFIKTALNNHFKKEPGCFYNDYTGHPEDIYWEGSEIEVKGNTVKIKEISEA